MALLKNCFFATKTLTIFLQHFVSISLNHGKSELWLHDKGEYIVLSSWNVAIEADNMAAVVCSQDGRSLLCTSPPFPPLPRPSPLYMSISLESYTHYFHLCRPSGTCTHPWNGGTPTGIVCRACALRPLATPYCMAAMDQVIRTATMKFPHLKAVLLPARQVKLSFYQEFISEKPECEL